MNSVYRLVQHQAQQIPDAPAIRSIDQPPISYRTLFQYVTNTMRQMHHLNIQQQDRVAIVLPNGVAMATSFLSTACAAVAAPLNPAYRAAEYEFYLTDLNARALITQPDLDSPAVEVARRLNIPVIELPSIYERANENIAEIATDVALPTADDIALILHTSGTTSRPKIVPLTHGNLCASARNISQTLALTSADRCLNIMPLFHIHGLLGVLLSSLHAGASVVCTPGFDAPHLLDWLWETQATWYSAVPTMHQAILARAEAEKPRTALRLIRSSSASLPPSVMQAMEQTFGVPVIEAYGMTEAAHQMASNPLPPLPRKPGSVGMAVGPEIAIMDEAGQLLPAAVTGEVVIRGENVTIGYENNAAANQTAFTNGWFRTGDQGYLDRDGYLFLTGRLKELINRGGEKISPREVDEVLLTHPAVAQAVAFAVPHTRLGEDVAAAVVLRAQASVTERDLRDYCSHHLTDFKVPNRIVFLTDIPKGPTGKLQRIGLAAQLGITEALDDTAGESDYLAPRNAVEQQLAQLWSEVLRIPATQIGIQMPFLSLGGDSMLATRLVTRVRKQFKVTMTIVEFFNAATVEEQAALISGALLTTSI